MSRFKVTVSSRDGASEKLDGGITARDAPPPGLSSYDQSPSDAITACDAPDAGAFVSCRAPSGDARAADPVDRAAPLSPLTDQ